MATVEALAAHDALTGEASDTEMDVAPFAATPAAIWSRRNHSLKWLERGVLAALLVVAIITVYVLTSQGADSEPLKPFQAAILLVANLLPATAMLVLVGRRMALSRAEQNPIKSRQVLHVRLVAIFSIISAVPTLLLVIFASFLFQTGVQFWFSDSARGMLENAGQLAEGYYKEKLDDVGSETVTMAGDLRFFLTQTTTDDPDFLDAYFKQVLSRKLSESAIVSIGEDGKQRTTALVSPDDKRPQQWIDAQMMAQLNADKDLVVAVKGNGIVAVTRLFEKPASTFLYAKRTGDVPSFQLGSRAQSVLRDYQAMVSRSRILQVRFNIALYLISLLIIAATVWVALLVADRLVKPVNNLVDTAQKIAGGDLSARVQEDDERDDEISILSKSFNSMTQQLESQTGTMLKTNQQLEDRRAFIEAVLESISSGVISTAADNSVTLANSQAEIMLGQGSSIIGKQLSDIAPRFLELINDGQDRGVLQLHDGPDSETLAVQLSSSNNGAVITFEDISQQLADQRRAAWSDVARRIAHEIKNPLTPIQLAAERLQRRFSKEIGDNNGSQEIFTQLTSTIVRQVDDLRKIADEFSSFARMPKPAFRSENLSDIVTHAIFLFEVAHKDIAFSYTGSAEQISMVCDRRQVAQAVTNLLKNATEAISENKEQDPNASPGEISVNLAEDKQQIILEICDNGPGFPDQRERILEPYFTRKKNGSGLGLAIVQKIVDEHFGDIELTDAPSGGAMIRLSFDVVPLADKGNRGGDAGSDADGE